MVGWNNCCRGASAGGPCGISLTYVWGMGRLVARHWLVDDGLLGVTVWCGWFGGRRSEDAWIISMHRQWSNQSHLGGTSYSTLVCSSELGTLQWSSVLLLSVEYGNSHMPKPHYTKFATSTQCIKSLLMRTNLFPWM